MTIQVSMKLPECSDKGLQPVIVSAVKNCVAVSKNQAISVYTLLRQVV